MLRQRLVRRRTRELCCCDDFVFIEHKRPVRPVGSILSIASEGSILSIGSVGSILSVGSIGSVCSVLSVGSAGSVVSALSLASKRSVLSARAADRALGMPTSAGRRRAVGIGLLAVAVVFLRG